MGKKDHAACQQVQVRESKSRLLLTTWTYLLKTHRLEWKELPPDLGYQAFNTRAFEVEGGEGSSTSKS